MDDFRILYLISPVNSKSPSDHAFVSELNFHFNGYYDYEENRDINHYYFKFNDYDVTLDIINKCSLAYSQIRMVDYDLGIFDIESKCFTAHIYKSYKRQNKKNCMVLTNELLSKNWVVDSKSGDIHIRKNNKKNKITAALIRSRLEKTKFYIKSNDDNISQGVKKTIESILPFSTVIRISSDEVGDGIAIVASLHCTGEVPKDYFSLTSSGKIEFLIEQSNPRSPHQSIKDYIRSKAKFFFPNQNFPQRGTDIEFVETVIFSLIEWGKIISAQILRSTKEIKKIISDAITKPISTIDSASRQKNLLAQINNEINAHDYQRNLYNKHKKNNSDEAEKYQLAAEDAKNKISNLIVQIDKLPKDDKSPKRVFISFRSLDGNDAIAWRIAKKLIQSGIDCRLDEFKGNLSRGWINWMEKNIESGLCDYILFLCPYSSEFHREGNDGINFGFEIELIQKKILERTFSKEDVIPIKIKNHHENFLPSWLYGCHEFILEPEANNLTSLISYINVREKHSVSSKE